MNGIGYKSCYDLFKKKYLPDYAVSISTSLDNALILLTCRFEHGLLQLPTSFCLSLLMGRSSSSLHCRLVYQLTSYSVFMYGSDYVDCHAVRGSIYTIDLH